MTQPRRCFMRFHVACSPWFMCYCCTLCSCKGHSLCGIGSWSHKMFYCSMFWCLCWIKKKNQSCNLINRLISCCFLHTVTHLPHFFVAVVSKVQVVCCYDFIASVIIIIWICWKSETEYINIRWSFLFAPKERNGRSCQVCQNSFLQSGSVQPNYKEAYSLWYAACRKFQYFVPRFCDIRLWGFCRNPDTKEEKLCSRHSTITHE